MLTAFGIVFSIIVVLIVLYTNSLKTGQYISTSAFVLSFVKKYGGNTLSHLLFLEDKQVFLAQNDSVLISYKQMGKKLFVLGDPIGDEERLEDGLEEFFQFALKQRLTPIFYQASERYTASHKKRGYRLFKIGEEAKVNLTNFVIEGKKFSNMRNIRNKFTKEGYSFSVVHPPFSKELMEEMQFVSDEWLHDRKEKGFSVSSFSEDYIGNFSVSLFRDPNGCLLAFASLPSDYQQKQAISIDLMRYRKHSPRATMDMVFISTILWAKEKGYSICSLGMSPLSNVGIEPNSPYPEKIARYAFLNGCKFYNFKGLRKFKGKFATNWTPRYLVYKKSLLFFLIIQLIIIVRKEPKQKESITIRKYIRNKQAI
ncbi:hypothetical protein CJ195_20285 [Bacillus sp. UMB0899]|uniref:phosphatidylglycerol lysyltransferase domain-containing protein n=1 Tax=Metabacillus schmidteae TaxID=2730405 RepID=UPI000C7FEE99|nr:phosphatidylglycerol lysyltransferase domain-containing protein [Metabacillus schmidteae]PMC35133.1 hypothetical protein CJ195_20285 [Bacillus sp. UMB0899]